jgi:hypothetical protein
LSIVAKQKVLLFTVNLTEEKFLVRIWKCVENAVKDSYLSKDTVTPSVAGR